MRLLNSSKKSTTLPQWSLLPCQRLGGQFLGHFQTQQFYPVVQITGNGIAHSRAFLPMFIAHATRF